MNKKLLITSLICFLIAGIASTGFSADGDITQTESIPDVAKWELDTVVFRAITQTAEVTYRKVDSNGDPTGLEKVVLFINRADDPSTPEDESLTEFTQLIQAINNNSNIKQTVTNAVKIKLGIN